MSSQFHWLHITDLHCGMSVQNVLWPNVKHLFFQDLCRHHEKFGPWHVVLFSGDLTQRGDAAEFKKLNEILTDLWALFGKLGFCPKLITTAGNHEVQRPDPTDPEVLLLDQWFTQPSVRAGFFSSKADRYRATVDQAFYEYKFWLENNATNFGRPDNLVLGLLPGDSSTILDCSECRIGIVTLNSAWLQLTSEDYFGRLNIGLEQLMAVTNNDPPKWCSANDLNILVTHHSPDWLHPEAKEVFEVEIAPPGRFDLHMFGHQHEATSSSIAIAGSASRHVFQGPSLFGLEKIGDNGVDRIHGHAFGRVDLKNEFAHLKIWPRILNKIKSGERIIIANPDFKTDDDQSFQISIARNVTTRMQVTSGESFPRGEELLLGNVIDKPTPQIENLRYKLKNAPTHFVVRRVEQQLCIESLNANRCVWVVSQWGEGGDEFLWCVLEQTKRSDGPVYQIEASEFSSKEAFLSSFSEMVGLSFESFCEQLADRECVTLLFDNVPALGKEPAQIGPDIVELESVIEAILDFCPSLLVILRTAHSIERSKFPIIILKALDEPDLKAYIQVAAPDRTHLTQPDSVASIYRITDGNTVRIDVCLKQLEVVSLSELIEANSDYHSFVEPLNDAPLLMQACIRELQESSDDSLVRSFELLQTLSLFPRGEQLGRIKRINDRRPFHPQHALNLRERGLIQVSERVTLNSEENHHNNFTLIVPRSVRDYVRTVQSSEKLTALNERCADICFGTSWRTGRKKWPQHYDYKNPNCGSNEIENASAIIFRLLRSALTSDDDTELAQVELLAHAFVASLNVGDHYRSVILFCAEFLKILPSDRRNWKVSELKLDYGRSLRMFGRRQEAIEVLSEILEHNFSNSKRQHLMLNLALAYQSGDNDEEAKSFARQVFKIDRNTSYGLHAQAILLELESESNDRSKKLKQLEDKARRNKAYVVANNLALSRASSLDATEASEIFAKIIRESRDSKDSWNTLRAIIESIEAKLEQDHSLTDIEQSNLIACYHFLFSERIEGLFNRCHKALWRHFAQKNDLENLLSLFRRSSFIWRLQGADQREISYLRQLSTKVKEQALETIRQRLAFEYFKMRELVLPSTMEY